MVDSNSVRTSADIEPFWLRLRSITLYPLQREALLTIAVLAVARLVSYVPGLFGWVGSLMVTVALLKYAGEVLVRTANGRMNPPTGYSTDNEVGWALLRTQALLIVMVIAGILLGAALNSPWLAIAFVALVAFGTPGALTSAAIDGDHWAAINPALWLQVMSRLGWPYFVVAILCAVIAVSQANAQSLIVKVLPGPFGLIGFYLAAHYATIVTFHLMGYLVYQYHDEVGYEIQATQTIKRPADRDQELLDQAETLVTDGNMTGAEALLGEHIRERAVSDAVHLRYRKLLKLRGDNAALLRHGRDYLNVLMARDDQRRAMELLRDCRELDAGFWPSDPDHVHVLASKALQHGLAEAALRMVSGFHKAFPKHGDVPRNYLFAAKILAERLNQDQKARALLQQISSAYPNHPLKPEIDAYLAFLEKLGPSSSARAG